MSPGAEGPPSPARRFRTGAAALIVSPVVIVAVIAFGTPPADTDPLAPWVVGTVVALVVAGFLLAEVLGFRTRPLTPADEEPGERAIQAYTESMATRFALTEVPIVVTIALTFILTQGAWPLAVVVVAGVPAMAVQVWPTARNVRRVADRLESGGVRSGLRETFGV